MRITLPRKMLLAFRRECRAKYPLEHLACVWGHREGDNLRIEKIAPISYTASESMATYDYSRINKSKMAALRAGMEWLGTIHSHCSTARIDTCQHLSECDVETAIDHGELICGICYVFNEGRHTEVYWHQPVASPAVEYL